MNARRSFLAPAAPSDRDMLSVLARLTPKAKANLIERLVALVILFAPEADTMAEDEERLSPGTLRPERDGHVRAWRKRPRAQRGLVTQGRA